MKKLKSLIVMTVVIVLLIIGARLWSAPNTYGPASIPFPYDSNNIVIGIISIDPDVLGPKLLGGVTIRVGQEVVVDIKCGDRDGDAYSIRVLNWQAGMNLTVSNDPNDPTKLKWTPMDSQVGLHYINIEAWDFPPDPDDSLTDMATIVILVRPRNRSPVLLPWND